jgi:hypothetical protein
MRRGQPWCRPNPPEDQEDPVEKTKECVWLCLETVAQIEFLATTRDQPMFPRPILCLSGVA